MTASATSGSPASGSATSGSPASGRSLSRRLLGQFFQVGEVTEVSHIAARMRRIDVAVPELDWLAGQQVRVCVGDVTSPASWLDGLRRSYSVWDYAGGVMSLCVLDHGDGPGARWARSVRPGQEVLFSRPEGNLVPRTAAYHLFAGEETAAVAFGSIIRALVSGATTSNGTARPPALAPPDIRGVLEVDSPGDRLPLPETAGPMWIYRRGAPAAGSASLTAAIAGLDLPAEPGAAYVAGEARTVQAICQHLVRDRGWPRRAVRTKPFWSPGKTGMD